MKRILAIVLFAILPLACSRARVLAARRAQRNTRSRRRDESLRAGACTRRAGHPKEFPGALPYAQAVDVLMKRLERFGIPAESILWGQSTCVDDITNTKDQGLHPEVKGPFNFGGLAGLPFTGITGLDAFAHQVPDEGTALIAVGPHIGYDEREGRGRILRHDQHHSTSCCGALSAALTKLQSGELRQQTPMVEDYQQGVIEQFAWQHREEIMGSDEPLLALTRLIFAEAQREIAAYASKVRERHFKYAVVVGVIIINTDFAYPDYLWIDRLE